MNLIGRERLAAAAIWLALALAVLAPPLRAEGTAFVFDSIDGGQMSLADWRGRPVLVVNTASLCAFTPQYEGLQALYDRYRDAGLVVLAVPSDDFNQELGSEAEVRDFCELTYGLDLPMTEITSVRGPAAHPFYRALREQIGWEPRWNFAKVLIGPGGEVLGTWGSTMRPTAPQITGLIEAALGS